MKFLPAFFAILIGFNAGALRAQQRPMAPPFGGPGAASGERMEALRIAFFTEALSLSPEDAEVFWPVMRMHQAELESIRLGLDSLREVISIPESLSNERAMSCIDAFNELHAEETAAKAAMLQAIADALGPQRALQIPLVEERFRRRILDEVQNRRMQSQGPPRRPRR